LYKERIKVMYHIEDNIECATRFSNTVNGDLKKTLVMSSVTYPEI